MNFLIEPITNRIKYFCELFQLFYKTFFTLYKNKQVGFFDIILVALTQTYFTAVQALPMISALALVTGAISITQFSSQLSKFGIGSSIGKLFVMVVFREVSTIITYLIVIARSATAMASEIATKKLNKEIDALLYLGIDPNHYIIAPRVVSAIVSTLMLNMFFILISTIGAFISAKFMFGMSFSYIVDQILNAIILDDLIILLMKNVTSGLFIGIISCYHGLSLKKATTEVPQVTIRAVVSAIFVCFAFDIFYSALFYLKNGLNL